MQAFLGLAGYYRRYVKNFASIARPLYKLTTKDQRQEKGFAWTSDCDIAFSELKGKLVSSDILGFPNNHDKMILDTDASSFGIGCVLSQIQNNRERVLAYSSRSLTKQEARYCVTRLELLSVVEWCKKHRYLLIGRKFTIRTDHAALQWLMNFKDHDGQLARWHLALSEFKFDIVHREGIKHGNADGCSRIPCRQCKRPVDEDKMKLSCNMIQPKISKVDKETQTDELVCEKSSNLVTDCKSENKVIETPKSKQEKEIQTDTVEPEIRWFPKSWCAKTKKCRKRKKKVKVTTQLNSSEVSSDKDCTKAQGVKVNHVSLKNGNSGKEDTVTAQSSACSVNKNHISLNGNSDKKDTVTVQDSTCSVNKNPCTTNEISEKTHTTKVVGIEPELLWSPDVLSKAQKEDTHMGWLIILKQEGKTRPEWKDISVKGRAAKHYWSTWDRIVLKDGVAYRKWESDDGKRYRLQLLVPAELRDEVIHSLHGKKSGAGGHFSEKKTTAKVKFRYHWYGMSTDIRLWCKQCDLCGSRKNLPKKRRAELHQYMVGFTGERLATDILGPLPTNKGYQYILVVGDYFTRWMEAFPIRSTDAPHVAKAIVDNYLTRFGMGRKMHSDQGPCYEAQLFKEVMKLFEIDKTRTTPYHPQSDGMIERMNRTLLDRLAMMVDKNQKNWIDQLPFAMMAYRATVHDVTGETPNMMMLGREVEVPLDLVTGRPPEMEKNSPVEYANELRQRMDVAFERSRKHQQTEQRRQKRQYDKRAHGNMFKVGSPVWLYHTRHRKGVCYKLSRNWEGPFQVIAKLDDVVLRIQKSPRCKPLVVHFDRLKPYEGKNFIPWPVPSTTEIPVIDTSLDSDERDILGSSDSDECILDSSPIIDCEIDGGNVDPESESPSQSESIKGNSEVPEIRSTVLGLDPDKFNRPIRKKKIPARFMDNFTNFIYTAKKPTCINNVIHI